MKHFIKTLFLVLVTGAGVSQTCSVQASNVNATQHQAPATTRGPVDKNNNQHHEGPSASVGRILDLAKEPEPLPLKRLISASAIIHQSRSRSSSTVNLSERPSSNNDCGQLETRPRHRSGRSLRVVLKTARDLLTSGFSSIEQRAGNIFWIGSNLLATLIPLASLIGLKRPQVTEVGTTPSASLQLPPSTSAGSNETAPSKQSQQLSKTTAKLIHHLAAASNSAAGGLIQSRVEHVMGWFERSIEHLPNFPRLHPQECIKRSICEAHNEPNKYGAIGLTLRLLFPANGNANAPDEGSQSGGSPTPQWQDSMEYKVINKYRHAAGYGLATRRSSNGTSSGFQAATCRDKYEDCLVSLLEVAQKLVDLFVS